MNLKLKNLNLLCTNCHKKGHTVDRCWAKGGGQEGKGPKNCNSSGKMDDNKNAKDKSTDVLEIKSVEANLAKMDPSITKTYAWVAKSKKPSEIKKTTDWVLDSGATTHICPT
jgi:hypothetical protein